MTQTGTDPLTRRTQYKLRDSKGSTLIETPFYFLIIMLMGILLLTSVSAVPSITNKAEIKIISESITIGLLEKIQRELDTYGELEEGEFEEHTSEGVVDCKINYMIKKSNLAGVDCYRIEYMSTAKSSLVTTYIQGRTVMAESIGLKQNEAEE